MGSAFPRSRFGASLLCASLGFAPPVLAQDSVSPPPILPAPLADDGLPALNPDAPMADLPDLGVDWPDLTDTSDLPTGAAAAATTQTEIGDQQRYAVRLDGLEGIPSGELQKQFDALSTLENAKGKTANIAQIDRRAREDQDLLATIMRAHGYYAARVDTRVETQADGRILVILETEPGPVYTFAGVTLPGIEKAGDKAAGLETAFGVEPKDPVDAGKVLAGEAAVRDRIGREGFPFAEVSDPQVVVDHEERTATLVMAVDPGTARNFGTIKVANDRVFDADHIQTIARFKPGQPYDAAKIDDLRRALIQTGLISSAKIDTVPGATPDTVDLAIALEPAPPRTVAAELGYGTGEGVRLEGSWQHRNFIKPEGAVTFRAVAGTQEQLVSATLRRNNFQARDRVINGQVALSNIDRKAYAARTLSLSANIERQTNIIFQKKWIWSLGGELIASDERGIIGNATVPVRRTFFIGALPASLNYDGSDDLLNPTRGFRMGARVSPEASFQSGTFGYARLQMDASGYFPVTQKVSIAARTRLGTIAGAQRDRIAPSRRFYAGGGGSVRGYSYQSIGPRDVNNDPVGGRSLAEFSLEARVRIGDFGVVPFVDAGNISTGGLPTLDNLRIGAGIGARYYTNFGPIRIDVGTPINPQKGDPRIAVYVSLGQAF